MIIEGRTITTLAELRDFVDTAIAQAKVDPSTVRMTSVIDLKLVSRRWPESNVLDIVAKVYN